MLLANDAWWFRETGGASLAETLAGLDTEAIEDLLGKMEPDEAERLQHDWSFWARQKQMPPREWLDGEKPWHLIQSGRGWGKTRIGAETTNALAEAGEFAHGALIAPTTSDVRRVMVEGVSGIVTVSKPTFRPHYEPSKYLLTYPNGVELTTFSADKADRLRGPEHDYVWADECLVAGTLIATVHGLVPVESIRQGMYVHTRRGLRRVAHAWRSSNQAQVWRLETLAGRILIGTANHPVWALGRGYIPLRSACAGDILRVWDITPSQASCGEGAGGLSAATSAGTIATRASYSTEPYTQRRTARFLRGSTSITSTETQPTTTSPTWKLSPEQNTSSDMARAAGLCGTERSERRSPEILGRQKSRASPGVIIAGRSMKRPASERSSVLAPARQLLGAAIQSSARRLIARLVARLSCAISRISNIAPAPVATSRSGGARRSVAPFAMLPSTAVTRAPSAAPGNVAIPTATVRKVEPLRVLQAVYNLEVEGEHEYYANGILTHNCAAWRYPSAWDNMLFGLRLEAPTGSPPRLLATTTPRPVRIVRDLLADPATTVTRGSSYENRANLSPAYYATNIRKYEGTRLGLQEIHGQLLEDVPGALWNRAMIDATRGSEADETGMIVFKLKSGIYGRTRLRNMVRFALAIDPAVTSTEVSNETGMVWGARGTGDFSGHAFILGDLSGLHPAMGDEGWPQIAVRTYHEHRLDKVVAETNNGGDLVEATLRAIDRNVSYRSVWASRGKRARAEPISAIYDEGRVHHIGSFPDLEDEQCTYVPDQTSESPNRVDAIVWLLTHLLIDAPSTSDAGNYALLKR